MKKLDVGQTLQLLGNAGVILGILLLVYELNQNREMMEAQTRNDLNSGFMDYQTFVSDREFLDILMRKNDGEDLSRLDDAILRQRLSIQFRYFENVACSRSI